MRALRSHRLGIVLAAVALVALTFALLGLSPTLETASTLAGVALAGVAGVVVGAWVARDVRAAATGGATVGFVNALVGFGAAVLVRDTTFAILVGGCVGGAMLGAITGALGHLLILVIHRRG